MPIERKCVAALAVGSLVCIALLGLRTQAAPPEKSQAGGSVTKASAQLIPTTKTISKVKGTVTFTKTSHGIHVQGEITGLTPGEHGFHVHEYGVWNEDGMATGGHFNPTGAPHASHDSTQRHVGDMGNIKADEDGKATVDLDDTEMSFEGPNSILGRGLVVHEKADDLKTQPSGNAGGRLAVAIIGVAKP
jgi:Cu-Zn family superoxide dismutase